MSGRSVAVAGATGAVGRAMTAILAERGFPVERLRLFASDRSAGTKIETAWGRVEVEDLAGADPAGIDVALFSAGGARSREHAPRFAAAGAVVIDNSSAFRMDPAVPLVVAGVNDHAAAAHKGIIANPNCTTMVLLMAAAPLHRAAGLTAMTATSYQSTSGSGQKGMDELRQQVEWFSVHPETLAYGGWAEPERSVYPRPIGWNVIPFAGSDAGGGYTDEELKLVHESRKILENPDLCVEPTCVRVPTMVGHGIAATLHFRRPVSAGEAKDLLTGAPGVEVWEERVATPLDSAGIDNVLVSRIRDTIGTTGGVNLWAVGDNLRKGAALNAVQIAELL